MKYCSVFHSKLGWLPCTIGRSSFFTINHFNSILCSAYLHWKSWKREKKERNSWAAEPSRLTSLYIKLEFDLQNLQLQKWMKNKKNSCHCFKTAWYFGAKIQFFSVQNFWSKNCERFKIILARKFKLFNQIAIQVFWRKNSN